MKLVKLTTLLLSMLALGIMLVIPVSGQDLESGAVAISGSLDYVPTILLRQDVDGTTYLDVSEEEMWTGDIIGNATAQDRITILPSGIWEAWILFEIEATVLGDHEGTLTIMSTWKREAPTAGWHGEWVVLSGTDDLENVRGSGVGWGPGFNREDPEASPDIFYSGDIVFVEPASE